MPGILLRLECIGDGYKMSPVVSGITRSFFRRPIVSKQWVAEITGHSDRFGYNRKFLTCKRDYSKASGTGNRGIYAFYILNEGHIYEINSPLSWKHADRYFCIVENGMLRRLSIEEVDIWLNTHSV